MTREEAYWMAKALRKDTAGSMREFYNVVIAALEEEPCDDAISRRAVDEAIYDYSRSCDVNYAQIMEYIDKIPSVNLQDCDTCEVGNPCLYCKHEFEPQESEGAE